MFTIATLLFIGLLTGVYFKLGKHLRAKETEVSRNNLYKEYYKHREPKDEDIKETQPKIIKYIKKKVLCKSKYKKRFV